LLSTLTEATVNKGFVSNCFKVLSITRVSANVPIKLENGKIVTATNNNGGINGGISNGMPIIFRTAIKPTPTIFKPQNTVDFQNMTETVLKSKGRHDPAIIHRARIVQDAASAIVICDLLAMRYGTDWLK
jgi:chorismate synthase